MAKQELHEQILRFPDVHELCGVSRSTTWRLEKDGKFPRRISIGPRAVGWRKSQILEWIKSRNDVSK